MVITTENSLAVVGFKSRKAAQIAAFFAEKNNLQIEKLALVKLIYLAERDFISKYSHPMLYDEFFSLPHGPICSGTLDGINGRLDDVVWSEFIVLKERTVKAHKKLPPHWRHCEPRVFFRGEAIQKNNQKRTIFRRSWIASPSLRSGSQ